MMEETKQLNFISEPEIFNTKYITSEEAPLIVLTGKALTKRETGDVSDIKVRYNFSSFDFPNLQSLFGTTITSIGDTRNSAVVNMDLDRIQKEDTFAGPIFDTDFSADNTLIIVVDNSFNIYNPNGAERDTADAKEENNANFVYNPKNLSFCFIDHHLYEGKAGSCPYSSNAMMIYSNFNIIIKILNKLLTTKQINKIGVLFHTDLDGIGSSLLIAKILSLIINRKADTFTKEDLSSIDLAMVLGEYGDISDNKKEELFATLKPAKAYESGLSKKFDLMSKNLGRFMKAIRPIIDSKAHIRSVIHCEELKDKYNELKFTYKIGYEEFLDAYLKIKEYFNDLSDVNNLAIICFISKIVQDPVNRAIIDLTQKEIDFLVDSYLRPETPQIDFTGFFSINGVDYPEYRVFVIDTPLDIGRSMMWTYRGRLQYFKDPADPKKFNMANYKIAIPEMVRKCGRMAAYNIFSGKLSLHSDKDNSAYNIAKALNGGGHSGVGEGSLGSVMVDFGVFREKFKITEMV